MRFSFSPVAFFIILFANFGPSTPTDSEILWKTTFPPCKACKTFVEAFKRQIQNTSKNKFEGGDAAWEEEKLGNYANSEIRLVEIQENVCSDVQEGRHQCYAYGERTESLVETWWVKLRQKPDLYTFLCIDELRQCCPDLHFGKDCTPCEGQPNNVCSNRGKCKGSGTRLGNGECFCEKGYTGRICNVCDSGYYTSYQDSNKFLCAECHRSCEGNCTSAGPMGCKKCKKGWILGEGGKGCVDVNECAGVVAVCKENEFCVNNDGSYKCLSCDKSCGKCSGDGPDMCLECAKGFIMKNNMCVDKEQEERREYIYLTRYLTYFGLCVATCIMLQRSLILASIVGIAVGIYIAVSEYMLGTPPDSVSPGPELVEKLFKKH